MPPTRPGQRVLDKAAQHEREQRILAAQARREAGLLKSKNVSIEGDVPEALEEVENDRGVEQADQHHAAPSLEAAQGDHAASAGVEHRHDVDPDRTGVGTATAGIEPRIIDQP